MSPPSINDLLVAAYERHDLSDDARWQAYSVAVLCLALGTGALGPVPESLARRALDLWQTPGGDAAVEPVRVSLWEYLDEKNGNSTTIADPEDHAARTALCGMFEEESRQDAHDGAEWADFMLADGWQPDGYVREILSLTDEALRHLLSEQFALLGRSAAPGLLAVVRHPGTNAQVRFEAAQAAVWLGETGEAADVLIKAVETDSGLAPATASQLARGRVERAVPVVARALEQCDMRDPVAVTALSDALRELGGRPTEDTLSRIEREAPDWLARTLLQDWRSAPPS